MCDQFDLFLKFQKKAAAPMEFCSSQSIAGITWRRVYEVDSVQCQKNVDGSVELDVNYKSSPKWFREGLEFTQLPQTKHVVLKTNGNFDEHWSLLRPSGENRFPTSDNNLVNAALFHSCTNDSRKCFMFVLPVKE